MNLIVMALKQKLAPFGWVEQVRRHQTALLLLADMCGCLHALPWVVQLLLT